MKEGMKGLSYLWLAAAICGEVIATSSLKASNGFTRPGPSITVGVGYGIAFYCLSQTLKTIPVGVAYGIWAGAGTALIALVGLVIYRQTLDRPALIGLTFIIIGVLIMNLFSKSVAH